MIKWRGIHTDQQQLIAFRSRSPPWITHVGRHLQRKLSRSIDSREKRVSGLTRLPDPADSCKSNSGERQDRPLDGLDTQAGTSVAPVLAERCWCLSVNNIRDREGGMEPGGEKPAWRQVLETAQCACAAATWPGRYAHTRPGGRTKFRTVQTTHSQHSLLLIVRKKKKIKFT